MKITPFDYQEEALVNLLPWIESEERIGAIILPPGCGKTFTGVLGVQKILGQFANRKILWTANRTELVDQALEAFNFLLPDLPISAEIAARKGNQESQIIVASIQTIYRDRANLRGWVPDVIVVDEYHHASDNNVQYKALTKRWPKAKILALSATLWRNDDTPLKMGTILVHLDIATAIEKGYLINPIFEKVSPFQLKNLKSWKLPDLLSSSEAVDKIFVNRIISLVKEGRQGLLFASSTEHAKDLFDTLQHYVRAAQVYYDTPTAERKKIMEDFKVGKIDCLINFLIGVEGLNVPHISFVAINRDTESLQILQQIAGRGLRTHPGKENCVILSQQNLSISDFQTTVNDLEFQNKEISIFGQGYSISQILNKSVKPVLRGVINKLIKV